MNADAKRSISVSRGDRRQGDGPYRIYRVAIALCLLDLYRALAQHLFHFMKQFWRRLDAVALVQR